MRIEEISIYHQMSCFVKPLVQISRWVSTSKGLLKQSTGKGENELVVEVRWLGFIIIFLWAFLLENHAKDLMHECPFAILSL